MEISIVPNILYGSFCQFGEMINLWFSTPIGCTLLNISVFLILECINARGHTIVRYTGLEFQRKNLKGLKDQVGQTIIVDSIIAAAIFTLITGIFFPIQTDGGELLLNEDIFKMPPEPMIKILSLIGAVCVFFSLELNLIGMFGKWNNNAERLRKTIQNAGIFHTFSVYSIFAVLLLYIWRMNRLLWISFLLLFVIIYYTLFLKGIKTTILRYLGRYIAIIEKRFIRVINMLFEDRMKRILKHTSVAWIAIYSAIIGVTSLIPILPYSGGGGYAPLSISFIVMAPFLLGFAGGIISAFIGGLIGMFIAPGAFPMGFFDVIFIAVLLSSFVGFAINGDIRKYRRVFSLIYLCSGLLFAVVPYYLPGKSGGFMPPSRHIYFLIITALFWVPWLLIYLSPLGNRYIPFWAKQKKNIKLRYFSVFVASLTGLMCWGIFYNIPYFLVLNIPNELAIATLVLAVIFLPVFAIIATSFTISVVRHLEKLGYSSPPGAIWDPSNR